MSRRLHARLPEDVYEALRAEAERIGLLYGGEPNITAVIVHLVRTHLARPKRTKKRGGVG